MYTATQRLYSIYYKLRRERDEAAVVRNLIHFMVVFYTETELAEMAGHLALEVAQRPEFHEVINRVIAEAPQIGRFITKNRQQSVKEAFDHTAAMRDEGVTGIIDKGVTYSRLSEPHAAMATCNEIVERFGDSDMPEMQVEVAWALVNKGAMHGLLGEVPAAITTCNEIVERFGDSDMPEIQAQVARALVNKANTEIQIDCMEEALHTCDKLERRVSVLRDNEKLMFERWSKWLRAKVHLVLGKKTAAMAQIRAVYALSLIHI